MQAAWALQDAGYDSIMINSNPETVSTDFDASDRLYFEPLDERVVRDSPRERGGRSRRRMPPVIVQFGGQTAINLAEPLSERGVTDPRQLGTDTIDLAEDRERFEAFLRGLGIPQPPGAAVTHVGRRDRRRRADRLPGAGAAVLRARRAGDGDRLQRRPTSPATSATRPA